MTMPNKSIVLRLIQKATENSKMETKGMPGKKALQKSIYLFSLKHGCFNFRWADYGPFNVEVQQIVQDLTYNGKISMSDMPIKTEKEVFVQNIQCSADSETFESFPDNMDKTLDHIVEFIEGKRPKDLEWLASVHYWAQRQQRQTGNYDAEYIYEKLTALKPNAKFTEDDVKKALQELEKGGFRPTLKNNPRGRTKACQS